MRELRLDEQTIKNIEDEVGSDHPRKCLRSGVLRWAKRRGANATIKDIMNALKELKYIEVAGM